MSHLEVVLIPVNEEEYLFSFSVSISGSKTCYWVSLKPIGQDLPGALDDAAVTEALELHKIKSRQWAIFKTCAVKGEGLFEGLDW